MFSTDRDLLAIEPAIFRDLAWAGQRLVSGIATVEDDSLTFDSQDVGLDVAGVAGGHVAVVGGVSYEVIEALNGQKAVISRLRDNEDAAALPPTPIAGADAWIATFAPQARIVHTQLLRMAGIEPEGAPPLAGRVGESAITNGAALRHLEVLGVSHLVYAAAGAAAGPRSPAQQRAELYRALFRDERERAVVELDLDGDGKPDATRRLNLIQLVR